MSGRFLISCEHACNDVPAEYAALFRRARCALRSHRGYDPGALELGRRFQQALASPLFAGAVTRLLVELNRSPHHPRLFSEFSQASDEHGKQRLLREVYWPYRRAVTAAIEAALASVPCVTHLSMHSFTPALNGVTRTADVGLLYDPRRPGEKALCAAWKLALRRRRPDLAVRCNYPYRGAADGFTTALRKRFGPGEYLGVELEVNQRWPRSDARRWEDLQESILASFVEVVGLLAPGAESTDWVSADFAD